MKVIVLGFLIYFALLILMCMFFKGATQKGNEYEERKEMEEILKKIEKTH